MSDPNPNKNANHGEHGAIRTAPLLSPRLGLWLLIASLMLAGVGVALPAIVIVRYVLPAQDRSENKLEAIKVVSRKTKELESKEVKAEGEYIRRRLSNNAQPSDKVLKDLAEGLHELVMANYALESKMHEDWLRNEHVVYEQATKVGQTALLIGGVLTILGLIGATSLRFARRTLHHTIWGLTIGLLVGTAMAVTATAAFDGAWCAANQPWWWAIPTTVLGPLVGWGWGAAIRQLSAKQTASEPTTPRHSEGDPS